MADERLFGHDGRGNFSGKTIKNPEAGDTKQVEELITTKEMAKAWVDVEQAKDKFKAKEKVVYRKRLNNKVRRKAHS